jgi:ribosome modulation factor
MAELEFKNDLKKPYDEGYEASQDNKLEASNPYDNDDHRYFEWLEGWIDCELFKRRIQTGKKE